MLAQLEQSLAAIKNTHHQTDSALLATAPRHIQYESDDKLLSTLLDSIQLLIKEEWQITYSQRQRLVDALDTSVTMSLDLHNILHINQRYTKNPLKAFKYGGYMEFAPYSTHVSISNNDVVSELPRRLGSGLLFTHDLAVSLWGGYIQHSPLTYSSAEIGPKMETHWVVNSDDPIIIKWPTPEWWTFRDSERFTRHWRLHADQCGGRYGHAWLAAMLEVMLHKPCCPGADGLTKERLTEFVAELIQEKPVRTARRLLRDSGLAAIALLLVPETMSELDSEDYFSSPINLGDTLQNSTIMERIRADRTKAMNNEANDEINNAWRPYIATPPQRYLLDTMISPRHTWEVLKGKVKTETGLLEMKPGGIFREKRENLRHPPAEDILASESIPDSELLHDGKEHYDASQNWPVVLEEKLEDRIHPPVENILASESIPDTKAIQSLCWYIKKAIRIEKDNNKRTLLHGFLLCAENIHTLINHPLNKLMEST